MNLRVQHVASAVCFLPLVVAAPSWAAWPSNHNDAVAVCTASGLQQTPVICSDGDGGALIAWDDARAGNRDIYALRLLANGDIAPGWATNGNAMVSLVSTQSNPAICSDGSGGAIITWQDNRSGTYDIYAQRVNASGVVQWTANGVQLVSAVGNQQLPKIVPDNGGAFVAWEDLRAGGSNADIYGQRVTSAGALAAGWGALVGKPIETAAGNQIAPRIALDGTGGVLVVYLDPSFFGVARRVTAGGTVLGSPWGTIGLGNDFDFVPDGQGGLLSVSANGSNVLSYQRIDPTGNLQWASSISPTFDGFNSPRAASDGVGGMLITCGHGLNTLMIRIGIGGAIVSGWPFTGLAILNQLTGPDHLLISDGSRGAILLWSQAGAPGKDIWAQHVDYNGKLVVEWPAPGFGTGGGVAMSLAALDQFAVDATGDGVGGAIATWADQRPGAGVDDIYAQRIDFYGQLGYPEPKISEVRDVKGDQGGQIRIRWAASYLDSVLRLVESYSVWRQVPSSAMASLGGDATVLATSAIDARARARALAEAGSSRRVILTETTAAGVVFWEFLASLQAHGSGAYSYVAETTSDSTDSGNAYTIVRVDAVDTKIQGYPIETRQDVAWWRSKPDSGYSVDNLAPAAPAPFAGTYGGGTAMLHWRPNAELDLAGYRLYRGNGPGFTPDVGSLIATPTDTLITDVAGAPYWYKVSATDVHGNEGPTTTLLPDGALDAGGSEGTGLFLAGLWPNPMSESGSCRFRLSRAGPVRLTLHDLQGRRVRALLDGWSEAGPRAVDWDGADDAGRRVAPGLYVIRLVAEGSSLTRKVLVNR
jgi:flagellar hook capping protein FlgD